MPEIVKVGAVKQVNTTGVDDNGAQIAPPFATAPRWTIADTSKLAFRAKPDGSAIDRGDYVLVAGVAVGATTLTVESDGVSDVTEVEVRPAFTALRKTWQHVSGPQ